MLCRKKCNIVLLSLNMQKIQVFAKKHAHDQQKKNRDQKKNDRI